MDNPQRSYSNLVRLRLTSSVVSYIINLEVVTLEIGKRNDDNILYRKIYTLWYNIKRRCYNKSNPQYHNYGGKGVVMCERWLELDNFIEDVDRIRGFNVEAFLKGNLAIDKDTLDRTNKIYSLDTCVFISREENNKVKVNQQKEFIATSPEGKTYREYNQSEFAKLHGLKTTHICSCLNGRAKTTKGWKFEFVE